MPHPNRDDVLAAMTGRFADFYNQYALLKPNGGELRGPCPIHGGLAPNFAVNPLNGHWYCHSGCQDGGTVFDFLERQENLSFPEALARVAGFAGLSFADVPSAPPKPRPTPPAPKPVPMRYLDAEIAERLHQTLMNNDRVRLWLSNYRGLTTETLTRFQVGLLPPAVKGEEWRVCFPIYDRQGRLTNIRKHLFAYNSSLTDERRRELGKTLPWEKGLRADLYPLSVLDGAQEALIVEGEADALLACQMGFAAVTGTLGAGNWKSEWTEELRGCQCVTILYDADQAGQDGAKKTAQALASVISDVRIASLPEGEDFTSWVVNEGATATQVQAVIDRAAPFIADKSPKTSPPPLVTAIEPIPAPTASPWPEASPEMFYGLAGDIVRILEPHTEADPIAILVQVLGAFGSAIGRSAHFTAEADQHYGNLFCVLIGISSKGRKGTSWGQVRRLFEKAEPVWATSCLQSGLSSGEGLIWNVRDPVEKEVKNKKTGEMETVLEDSGVTDKRLLVQESEFASVLRVAGRDGSTLSAVLRDAWDRGRLQTMTKNNAAKATGAHVSVIGHITADELRRELGSTEAGNGFANRFLWICVRRSKELPEGGNLQEHELNPLVLRLQKAITAGQKSEQMHRDAGARDVWLKIYHDLSAGGHGLLGAVTSRGEAQVMRLALLYALLDGADAIQRQHLLAALALWEYAEASAKYVFGDSLGDPVADSILRALSGGANGLTRTEIGERFSRHESSGRIDAALALLHANGRVRGEKQSTAGRPVERWFSIETEQEKPSEESARKAQ